MHFFFVFKSCLVSSLFLVCVPKGWATHPGTQLGVRFFILIRCYMQQLHAVTWLRAPARWPQLTKTQTEVTLQQLATPVRLCMKAKTVTHPLMTPNFTENQNFWHYNLPNLPLILLQTLFLTMNGSVPVFLVCCGHDCRIKELDPSPVWTGLTHGYVAICQRRLGASPPLNLNWTAREY